eukprot:8805285-Karenia_brevis.AAC.1
MFSPTEPTTSPVPVLALSNAAVWWPNRTSPPADAEYTMAYHKLTQAGLQVFAPMHGPSTSSTRP